MSGFDLPRRLAAELLGTGTLVAAVVGSGIMAERLAGGNQALALLCNTLPTGAILVVLILILGPVSGAHLNPVVSLAMRLRRELSSRECLAYVAAQMLGGVLGTMSAHLMFELPLLGFSLTARSGLGQWAGEVLASFGLLATILGCLRFRADAVPYAVGLFITSAYWFTSSTSFANPAVTVARSLSNTFAGIAPADVAAFVAAQLAGALAATAVMGWLLTPARGTAGFKAAAPSSRAPPGRPATG